MVPTVKYGGGNVLKWRFMSAKNAVEFYFIEGTMNSQMRCTTLKEKMLLSLHTLSGQALFHHNDPKHSSKATAAFLRKNKVKVLQWQSMSPNLNLSEHL